MEMMRLDAAQLGEADIVSLLELYRGASTLRPLWQDIRKQMERYEAWGFYIEGKLIGFAWFRPLNRMLDRTVQLVKLRYHWQYNTEEFISQMLNRIAEKYRQNYDHLLLDIDVRHELNLELYRRLGFSKAFFTSPQGRGYAIYLAKLN